MSQYRLIAYKDGQEVARSVGGETVRGLLDSAAETADIVELWEKKDGHARFQRVAVKSELNHAFPEYADERTANEAARVAEIAIRHYPVPADTTEFRGALEVVFAAGAAFGRAAR